MNNNIEADCFKLILIGFVSVSYIVKVNKCIWQLQAKTPAVLQKV